ncbi:uncharacterized protein LOC135961907 [Calliphora vicina]|uniref:uncharacterized protein LOC135961907 n=1 Tax=Calliphora vicina TaxID=7373 RepID=UPI00325B787C
MEIYILLTCLLQTALAAPQLISFKDGKVGVNFLGYHAEAGLGGGQNDGGLLGGLHASAGTPWGQNAAAGLGGNVNGRAAGVLYAGAQATPDVGAGAVLGGDTSQGGYSGSEAYANGKVSSRTRTIVAGNTQVSHGGANSQLPPQPVTENANAIQKIRPPKKYQSSETQRPVRRQLIAPPPAPRDVPAPPCDTTKYECKNVHREVRSDVVQSALQIPIGILQSLQQSFGNFGGAPPKSNY